jgi:hypothetical protein
MEESFEADVSTSAAAGGGGDLIIIVGEAAIPPAAPVLLLLLLSLQCLDAARFWKRVWEGEEPLP